jgi:hypothetical protein
MPASWPSNQNLLSSGLPFERFVQIKPATASLRVLVVDKNSGRMGSVTISAYSIFDSGVYGIHAAKWLFPQEKATFYALVMSTSEAKMSRRWRQGTEVRP